MCLYPRLIKNKKYESNNKNGGIIPTITDTRVLAVPVGCGNCMECKKKKAREWQIRLSEEIRTNKKGIFVTLTFSNEKYTKWAEKSKATGYERDNDIAKMATRNFLENWRKKYKKSVRHWLITELGHNGTENIHMHGIIWTDHDPREIRRIWKNGWVWIGNQRSDGSIENYVTERTVNYIIKYVHKSDEKHRGYKSKILCSKGIGSGYMERGDKRNNIYQGKETDETYRVKSGHRVGMPMYYRNKIYTEEEREKLWLIKLDENVRWVDKQKIDISENEDMYYQAVKWARRKNEQLGYGGGESEWKQKEYEQQRRELLHKKRIEANAQESGHAHRAPSDSRELLTTGKEEGIKWGSTTEKWD